MIEPSFLPAGTPTTGHRVYLVQKEALDPEVHALRIGDTDHLTRLETTQAGDLYFTSPVKRPGVYKLVVHTLEGWASEAP